jgi:cell division protein FtsW (lipid II flippase)
MNMIVMQTSAATPLEFRPVEHTDFIFAASPEALAVIGLLIVAAVFAWSYFRRRRADRGGQHDSPAT